MKPLVWRVRVQATMPSRCTRIILTTAFINSTLERFMLMCHCLSILYLLSPEDFPELLPAEPSAGGSLAQHLGDPGIEFGALFGGEPSLLFSKVRRSPLRERSRRCSMRRVRSTALEAWATTWNLSKVTRALDRFSEMPLIAGWPWPKASFRPWLTDELTKFRLFHAQMPVCLGIGQLLTRNSKEANIKFPDFRLENKLLINQLVNGKARQTASRTLGCVYGLASLRTPRRACAARRPHRQRMPALRRGAAPRRSRLA